MKQSNHLLFESWNVLTNSELSDHIHFTSAPQFQYLVNAPDMLPRMVHCVRRSGVANINVSIIVFYCCNYVAESRVNSGYYLLQQIQCQMTSRFKHFPHLVVMSFDRKMRSWNGWHRSFVNEATRNWGFNVKCHWRILILVSSKNSWVLWGLELFIKDFEVSQLKGICSNQTGSISFWYKYLQSLETPGEKYTNFKHLLWGDEKCEDLN